MKRKEVQFYFNSFYEETYSDSATYCLKKTGDFLNAEDFLVNVYYDVYKYFKRAKMYDPVIAHKILKRALNNQLEFYWKKHCKELRVKKIPNIKGSLEQVLQTEFDLTEELAERDMLSQDILEYISSQPASVRRPFVLYFYFEEEPETIASELNLSTEAVYAYLLLALKRIKKNILGEYI